MSFLFNNPLWGIVGALVFLGLFYHWVDTHGSSAQALAAINAAQATRNGKIEQQKKDDPLTVARESAEAAKADAEFKAAKKSPCVADQETADAINKLIGEQ